MSGTATPLAKYAYPTPILRRSTVEVFAEGPDLNIYVMYSSSGGAMSGPSSANPLMQLSSATAPWQHGFAAYADNNTNTAHIFSAFPNGDQYSIYHRHHNGNMSWLPFGGWELVDSVVNSSASVIHWPASDGQDRMTYLFIIDQNKHLSYVPFTNASSVTQSSWVDLGGTWATYTPAVVSTTDGRMHAFVVDPVSSEVSWKYFDGSAWQPSNDGFNNLHGYVTSMPTAVSSEAGRLDLFARGGDGGLWWKQYSNDNWTNDWVSISGSQKIKGEVEAITWGGDGTQKWIDVFAWAQSPGGGGGGQLLHKWYENGQWKPSEYAFDTVWQGSLGSPPKAVEVDGNLHVFAYDSKDRLVHIWQQGSGIERWTSQTRVGTEQLGQLPTT